MRLLTDWESMFCFCAVCSTMSGPVGKFVESLVHPSVCNYIYNNYTDVFSFKISQ